MSTPADVVAAVTAGVSRLVAGGLDEPRRAALLDELAGYYAESTDVRHPFAPLGDTPLRTRAELREHFAGGPGRTAGVTEFGPHGVVVHETADPEVVIVEFAYRGAAHGRSFEVPCIFVVKVRDGVIVESRDYADHVGMARAFGRLGDLATALADEARRA
ncbi:ketosteroid isomerase-like protein [Nocardia transvalensis]|uniref:Ketosteroid isomerase-like protein n=1 Tax=Nocardia transvalensis TaxID=37333 RepID=A0A7W9P964_9NOCA|nr:nuclear transport factor 2 family protein [Nocardia transvalensis]MBB5911712.1 ketosteroid isomerase-like protein [Nocardia transvalensis]